MAFLDINPEYREFLRRHGLNGVEDFSRLTGVIICGHPDRHVVRVTLGTGSETQTGYLKREHWVPWRNRLANAWAGFGLVSRSGRELAMFRALRHAGINCPEVLAAGEEGRQAFILIRGVEDSVDLGSALQQISSQGQRRRLTELLGRTLARLHAAGFDQPDLYAKHILLQGVLETGKIWFLDWQRSRLRPKVTWSIRCRDLAALDATLTDGLASDRERLACLRAYLRAERVYGRGLLAMLARRIRRQAEALLRRRYVRELREAPLRPNEQSLIWLDGEAVCVTPEFRKVMGEQMPGWLELFRGPVDSGKPVECRRVALPAQRVGFLVRRRENRLWRWLWDRLRGKTPSSPELEQAATLFRLERYGIALPRVLAVGQSHQPPWYTKSFLLTEPAPAAVDLADWLANFIPDPENQRNQVFCQAGAILRNLHQAGYYLDSLTNPRSLCELRIEAGNRPLVVLASVEGLRRSRKPRPHWAYQDLDRLWSCFSSLCSRSEMRCFYRSYHEHRFLSRKRGARAGRV